MTTFQLILVNGLRINNTQTGNRGLVWGGMPVNAIENIEIICGPGSAVYGADAFAGVINIITGTKDDINGTESGIRVGSFNTKEGWTLASTHHINCHKTIKMVRYGAKTRA